MLVLDEPTAHVDPQTARVLLDDVLDAAGDRSILLITHRPEGLQRMDEVVRIDAGARVEALRPSSSELDDADGGAQK